jgi:hypothetical protein
MVSIFKRVLGAKLIDFFFFFLAILLAAVVAIYTTLNDRSVKFSGGMVNYSWSYWMLYGAIGSYLLSAVFFCCNQPSHERD